MKKGYKVQITQQFERELKTFREKIIVKKGAVLSASHDPKTDMWKVAYKGRWVSLGNTVTASEYLVIITDDKSNKYRALI